MRKTIYTRQHEKLCGLLRDEREKAGISQLELVKKLGTYKTFVSKYEIGQRRVDVIEFFKIADIVGFDAIKALKKVKG